MTANPRRFSATLLSLAAGSVVLSGCDRDDDRSLGRHLDIRQAAREAVDQVNSKSWDLAITSEIHARLANDPALSALPIDVDTTGRRVLLRGLAPDASARLRASRLAGTVDGVVAVKNDLSVTTR